MIEDNTPFSEQNKKQDTTQRMWNAAHPMPNGEARVIAKATDNIVADMTPVKPPKVEPLPPSWPYSTPEKDPNGLGPHAPGAKLDAGKLRPALVLGSFARALTAVVEVGTRGAVEYSPYGWLQVEDGEARYEEAKMRHWLAQKRGEVLDPKTKFLHAAHEAWNALARLELMIRESEKPHG